MIYGEQVAVAKTVEEAFQQFEESFCSIDKEDYDSIEWYEGEKIQVEVKQIFVKKPIPKVINKN
jgi:hypothetical protein